MRPLGGLILGTAACAALATAFYSVFVLDGHLSGHDWPSNFKYYDWARVSLSEFGTLPLVQYTSIRTGTQNLLADPVSPILGPLTWLLLFLSTDTYLSLLLVVYTSVGLVGSFLLARDLGVAAPVAALCATIFAFNGFTAAHWAAGHHNMLGFHLIPLLVVLYRRAVRGSWGAVWGCAVVNAIAMFEGFNHPFVWQSLLVSVYATLWSVSVRSLRPLWVWVLIAGATTGLSAVKLLPMLEEFGSYSNTRIIEGIPAGAVLWSLVARGQSPETRIPEVAFAYGAGWWEYAFYIGAVAALVMALGLATARRTWPLAVTGFCFVLLALHWSEDLAMLDLWGRIRDWPILQTQRAPARFLAPALAVLIPCAGVGLQRLWNTPLRRKYRTAATIGALLLAGAVFLDLRTESLHWQAPTVGGAPIVVSHKPPGVVLPGTEVELKDFRPNQLVFRISTTRRRTVPLPIPWSHRGGWESGSGPIREFRGYVGVSVPSGEHVVVMRFRPRWLTVGSAASAIVACLGIASAALPVRRRSGLIDVMGDPRVLSRGAHVLPVRCRPAATRPGA